MFVNELRSNHRPGRGALKGLRSSRRVRWRLTIALVPRREAKAAADAKELSEAREAMAIFKDEIVAECALRAVARPAINDQDKRRRGKDCGSEGPTWVERELGVHVGVSNAECASARYGRP